MSISENVGALSNRFAQALSGRMYSHLREGGKKNAEQMPRAGTRTPLRGAPQGHGPPGTLFEEMASTTSARWMGTTSSAWCGPCATCASSTAPIPACRHPQGKGYARPRPIQSPGMDRVRSTGERHHFQGKSAGPTFSQIFGQCCATWRPQTRIVVITPAMREGSGLVAFSKRFPDRYFDVAIASSTPSPSRPALPPRA